MGPLPGLEGRTVSIVGAGASLLRLRREHFPPGEPVIAVGDSIVTLRRLGLTGPVFLMQKDGCVDHGADERFRPPPAGHVCATPPFVVPIPPETLIVSARESQHCFESYRPRIVIDTELDAGLRWYIASVPVAAALAIRSGAAGLLLLGLDLLVNGDPRRAMPDGTYGTGDTEGYRHAALLAYDLGRAARLPISLVMP